MSANQSTFKNQKNQSTFNKKGIGLPRSFTGIRVNRVRFAHQSRVKGCAEILYRVTNVAVVLLSLEVSEVYVSAIHYTKNTRRVVEKLISTGTSALAFEIQSRGQMFSVPAGWINQCYNHA